ncbi:hypothetical protein [Paraburkholderia bonniea]|uniref:hypothetical protein n=1 Tax=Paraburkholderia bonniea TaxID=2152891 RepID=UPI0012918D9F|nr:hypothetical protein [Paraburkholderia bonniea]
MKDQETLLTTAPYLFTPDECDQIKDGGRTAANRVIQRHATLKALGFENASIANMVRRKNGPTILNAVIQQFPQLRYLGYTLADIKKIATGQDGDSTLANVVKHHTRLAYLGYTHTDIVGKATGENPRKQLETTTENPEATAGAVDCKGNPLLSLTDGEIDKLLTISGGKFALDAIYRRGYDLTQPPLSFTSAQIFRIASKRGGGHTLETLWNRRQSLVDKGYSANHIYSILKNIPSGGSVLLYRLDTLHSEFLALGYSIGLLVRIAKRHSQSTMLQYIRSNQINAGSAIGQRLIKENPTVLELTALEAILALATQAPAHRQEQATRLVSLPVQVPSEQSGALAHSANLGLPNANSTFPRTLSSNT